MTVIFALKKPINGESPDVDELITNHSFILGNMLAYAIDGATTTNQGNFKYDALANTTGIDTGNTTAYFSSPIGGYLFCESFDDFGDASIDATKWNTTGTPTETGGYLNLGSSGDIVISSGASGFDAKTFSGNSEIIIDVNPTNGDSGADWSVTISNGTTHINIADGNGTATAHLYRVVINQAGETMDVYTDDTLTDNDVDISSVTTNWYIRFYRTGGTGVLKILQVSYAETDTTGTQDVVTDTETASSNSEAGIIMGNMSAGSIGSSEIVYSSDNGSNYATGDQKTLIKATVAGTGVKFRFRIAFETTISASAMNIPTLTSYAYYYG